LRKLDTVIHKNESHWLKMQRDFVVVILYDSIYNQCKKTGVYVLKTILGYFRIVV